MMKNIVSVFLLATLLFSCEKDNEDMNEITPAPFCGVVEVNEYSLLQIDYEDHILEKVYSISFHDSDTIPMDSIPIQVNFQPPMDFGNLTLLDAPSQEKIFDGGIIWMGLGEMTFPQNGFDPSILGYPGSPGMPMPAVSEFQLIAPEAWFIPELMNIPYQEIWNAADAYNGAGFTITNASKIGLFLYTPSVGIGDPADWDYFLVIYNQAPAIPLYPND